MHKIKLLLFIIIIIGIFFNGCTPYKRLLYLQGTEQTSAQNFNPNIQKEYRVQRNDVLFIKIISMEQEKFSYFNIDGHYSSVNSDLIYYTSYNVNDSGYINLPVIGKLNVENKTINEIKELIQQSVSLYLKDAIVIVKLLSFKVSVLGEVTHPGIYKIYDTRLNIIEAISLAGDLTLFGNRKKVKIIRTNENNKIINVDLTDINLLHSENYTLIPNDIIYVEPLKAKTFNTATSTLAAILSTITTTLLIITFFRK
jgi:polysaccharide export outer membrane protein